MASSSSEQSSSLAIDVESIATNYSGHGKINRLLFIARHAPSSAIQMEAAKLALTELKTTKDTHLYRQVAAEFGEKIGGPYRLDESWASSTDANAARQLERLEADLSAHKSNVIKESIRMGHSEIGDFFYDRGDLQNALKSYLRTRDYCTSSKHLVQMCLNVVRVALEQSNFSLAQQYISQAEKTQDLAEPVLAAKLKAASGLVLLDSKKYKQAARKFLEVSIDLGSTFSDVIAPQDVSIYAIFCGLATFDRAELRTKILENSAFKNFTEFTPQARELARDFHASRYPAMLAALDRMKPELMLDLHLRRHVDTLFESIRSEALIQYVSPFKSVSLSSMADAFCTSVANAEKELAKLITDGKIQARIDSHNKLLYRTSADQRSATFQKVMDMGDAYVRDVETMIRRMNVIKNDFAVKAPKSSGGGQQGQRENMQGPPMPMQMPQNPAMMMMMQQALYNQMAGGR